MNDMSFPDPAARLRKHVQDRLHLLEKSGQCPVCNTTQWTLLNNNDVTTQLPGWPTYALACERCGFVRHHLRSIFDGDELLAAPGEHGSRVAGGANASVLEAKVAVLEKIAASTDDMLAELRWDMKAVRSKQEEDYRSLADKISDHSGSLSEKISGSALRLYIAVGVVAAGVLGITAKGFKLF